MGHEACCVCIVFSNKQVEPVFFHGFKNRRKEEPDVTWTYQNGSVNLTGLLNYLSSGHPQRPFQLNQMCLAGNEVRESELQRELKKSKGRDQCDQEFVPFLSLIS